MSDTPRTDALFAARKHVDLHHDDWYALCNHARELEIENRELLEALKRIAEDHDIDSVGSHADGWNDGIDFCRRIALKAIAKAEGK